MQTTWVNCGATPWVQGQQNGNIAYDMLVALPDSYDANRATPYPWIVFCIGAGGTAHDFIPGNNATYDALAGHFTASGYVFIGQPYCADTRNWGDDYALNLVDQVVPWVQAHYNVSTKPVLGGGSMGGALALNYLRMKTKPVSALVLAFPVANFEAMSGGYQSEISSKYGGSQTAIDLHDPADHPSDYAGAGVPIAIWHGTIDSTVPYSSSTGFTSAVNALHAGAVTLNTVTGGEHDITTMSVLIAQVDAWLPHAMGVSGTVSANSAAGGGAVTVEPASGAAESVDGVVGAAADGTLAYYDLAAEFLTSVVTGDATADSAVSGGSAGVAAVEGGAVSTSDVVADVEVMGAYYDLAPAFFPQETAEVSGEAASGSEAFGTVSSAVGSESRPPFGVSLAISDPRLTVGVGSEPVTLSLEVEEL